MPDTLDKAELDRLPDVIYHLGIARTLEEAKQQVSQNTTASSTAQDTLATLFYLLPQTRSAITGSIREEYFRLGDIARLSKALSDALKNAPEMTKSAYEMVAVADHYGQPLPIEVLRAALGAEYSEIVDLTNEDGSARGLLYTDDNQDAETVTFHTRNAIITKNIVETINGGSVGHSGEVRVLQKLLSSCTGTALVYRQFCLGILLNHHLKRLEYQDGLALFDAAIHALQFPDKTLVHHKGIWIREQGREPLKAAETLYEALKTAVYPQAPTAEANEHVHTSIATAYLDAVDAKKTDVATAKTIILNHLEKAESETFFNPSAVHVRANLMLRLAKHEAERTPDLLALASKALADVDRTISILRTSITSTRENKNDLDMLASVKQKVLAAVGTTEDLKRDAEVLWTRFQSQEGFAVVARKLHDHAEESGKKGHHYKAAFDYVQDCIDRVKKANQQPSARLLEAALQVYYRWQVQPRVFSPGSEPIKWDLVRDYATLALNAGQAKAAIPFYRYLMAMALAHLGQWKDAQTIFQQVRANMPTGARWLLHTPRDMLLHEKGGRRTIQGKITQGAGTKYLYSDELQADLMLEDPGSWPRPGEITHAYVRFSFAGPMAVSTGQV